MASLLIWYSPNLRCFYYKIDSNLFIEPPPQNGLGPLLIAIIPIQFAGYKVPLNEMVVNFLDLLSNKIRYNARSDSTSRSDFLSSKRSYYWRLK